MNPAVPLSQAGPVEVVVRLSRSGAAAAAADDWEWRSETLALAEQQAPLKLSARLEPPLSEPAQTQDKRAQDKQAPDKQAPDKQESFLPSVKVDISAAGPVPSGSTLFVIARPPGGGMPYAVVRRQGEQLPLTVMLDDSVSMNPAVRLSQAGPVEVVVRLSRTGATAAGPGDWEWRSETLALAEQRAPLTLSARLEPPPG
jgi:cytochrome c-type biogenesis protein CcmH